MKGDRSDHAAHMVNERVSDDFEESLQIFFSHVTKCDKEMDGINKMWGMYASPKYSLPHKSQVVVLFSSFNSQFSGFTCTVLEQTMKSVVYLVSHFSFYIALPPLAG